MSQAMVGFGGQVSGEGYIPAPGTTLEALAGALRSMRVIRGAVPWWIGDLLLYAEAHFGEAAGQLLAEVEDLEVPDLLRYRQISQAYPLAQRVAGVSWSHHQAVAHLPLEDRQAWLERAKREGLSPKLLRQLRLTEKPTREPKDFTPGFIEFLHRVPPAIMELYDTRKPGTRLLEVDLAGGCRVEVTVRLRRVAASAGPVPADDAPDRNRVEAEGDGTGGLSGGTAQLDQG